LRFQSDAAWAARAVNGRRAPRVRVGRCPGGPADIAAAHADAGDDDDDDDAGDHGLPHSLVESLNTHRTAALGRECSNRINLIANPLRTSNLRNRGYQMNAVYDPEDIA
jgi:hypothetical protein